MSAVVVQLVLLWLLGCLVSIAWMDVTGGDATRRNALAVMAWPVLLTLGILDVLLHGQREISREHESPTGDEP